MTIIETKEILSMKNLIKDADEFVAEQLGSLKKNDEYKPVDIYKDYAIKTISQAQSRLNLYMSLIGHEGLQEEKKWEARKLLDILVDDLVRSISTLYLLASFFVEEFDENNNKPDFSSIEKKKAHNSSKNKCSLCGRYYSDNDIVVAPGVNICLSCARDVCSILDREQE